MNAMKNKIKSQKGASITFALLLFLVCAVISGVVVVAATTAAGRMSQQDEMDERYYAVTAAAKRLNDIFDGTKVTVKYDIKEGEPDFDSITVTDSNDNSVGNSTVLFKASKDVVQGVLFGDKASVIEPDAITITDDASKITCTVNRKMNVDGRMEYTISALKTTDVSKSGTYTVVVIFSPNLSAPVTDVPDSKGHADVTWKLLGAKKESATPKQLEDG